MKGAKINIRTSLTRKLTNKSISSSVSKLNDSELNSSHLNEACDNSLLNNSLQTPTEENLLFPAVINSTNSFEKIVTEPKHEESAEVIQGFKPKIIQHQTTHKQPFSLSMARQRVATRQVDLQWLDGCLADGECSTSVNKSNNADEEDVIYSTDDEAPKARPSLAATPRPVAYPPSIASKSAEESEAPPPIVNKRKHPEDEVSSSNKKRQRIDETAVLHEENGTSQGFVDSKEDNDSDCSDSNRKLDVGVRNSTKENSTNAAKRERLERYLDNIIFPSLVIKQSLALNYSKMASGTANQNFVRINLKKKVFARGKKTQTGSGYKRQQWKQRQMGGAGGGGGKGKGNWKSKMTLTCRRCGEVGHWAKSCMSDKLLSMEQLKEQGDEEELEFPTLEEAMEKADDTAPKKKKTKEPVTDPTGADDLQLVDLPKVSLVEPFCSIDDPIPPIVMQTLKKFGHTTFRPGQEEAVMRILSGKSTLVVQSTGAGKSLCYQLPAVVYASRSPAITIVVSPLVSLMEDQIANLPSFVKAACLHSGQSEGHRQKTLQSLQSGSIHILLMSAESVTSTGRRDECLKFPWSSYF